MKRIVVFGATSSIAQALIKLYAEESVHLYLIARNELKLTTFVSDLRIRHPHLKINTFVIDLADTSQHKQLIKNIYDELDHVDVALLTYGCLIEQKTSELSYDTALHVFNINLLSVISLLTYLSNEMEKQKHGTIAVITSVAGDRGRQSNYVYGAAKGGLTLFLQGLRNRLYKSHVHVVTIKPGMIDTPMTKEFKKGLLWSKPEYISQQIKNGIEAGANIIYTPKYWFYIMALIKSLPEFVYKKLKL